MTGTGARIDGLDFLKDQLEGFLPRETTAILRRTVTKIAAQVRNDIRAAAPKDTGTLRKAIRSKRNRGTRDEVEAGVYITTGKGAKHNAFYWHWIEFGTQRLPARPFVAPAAEKARAGYREALKSEVGRQVIKQLENRAKAQARRAAR